LFFSETEGFVGDSWTVQCEIIQQNMLGGQAQDEDPIPPAPEDGQQLPLVFFGLGQPMPPAGLDLNFPSGPAGGDLPALQDDNAHGDWDQWIENVQPNQHILQPFPPDLQPVQPDELQLSNQHSGLSSDSSFGAGQVAPLQNGHVVEEGPVLPGVGLAVNITAFNGPQEVDGPAPQVDHVPGIADLPHQAHVGDPNNNHFQNLEMNFMVNQGWQPDPMFQMFEERKRAAQFSSLWAMYFAPAGSTAPSVDIAKNWAPFFLSKLLQPEAFSWSKSFLLSVIPSALLEPGMESLPFAIPKECPNVKLLDDVLSESSNESGSCDAPAPIIVESELRRSKRLKESRVGFRHGACPKRNCLMCQHNFDGPPLLSSKVIRNLGSRFCNLSDDDLSKRRLKKKKSVVGVVGQQRAGRKDSDEERTDDSTDEDKQDER
jgi:hypothetical protein